MTVFTPTNDAFDALEDQAPGSLEALDNDSEALASVLVYHVAPGRVDAATVATGELIPTLAEQPIRPEVRGATVRLNTATTVTEVDRRARKGLIDVIDRVLLPPPTCDCRVCLAPPLPPIIAEILRTAERFGTWLMTRAGGRANDSGISWS